MKRIAANLTPLVTCPAFMLWHLIGAAMCIPALLYVGTSADPDVGGYVVTFILPAWSACVLTSLQKDLLNKPFTFCLPGHQDVLRLTTCGVGVASSLVASLPVLTFPGLDGLSLLWAAWSAFCFGLVVYLLMVGFQMLLNAATALPGLFVVVGGVLIEFTGARLIVQEAALFAPGWNTVVLAALSILTWRRLGSVDLARRICGGDFLSLQMLWRRHAGEEFGARRKRESMSKGTWSVRRWLLQVCFDRISRRPALSFRRLLAATQYELAGRLVPLTPAGVLATVLFVLLLLVVGGYAPPVEDRPDVPAANAVYIVSCLLSMHLLTPIFSSMLLTAGRRERFWSALTIAACNGLIVLGTSLLMYLLLLGMGTLAPPLSLGGEVYRFEPADLKPAFVPLVLLPLSIILKTACRKWLLVPEILLFFTAAMILTKGDAALKDLSLSAITVFLSVSWATLVGVLYSYSFHRDLVRE